jgi:rubrerythrin
LEKEELSGKDSQLIEIFRKQIDVEKKALEHVSKMEEEATETAVRLAFMNLRLDTWKHVKFLEGLIELIEAVPCDEWSAKVGRYAGRIKLEREVKKLAGREQEMIDLLTEALEIVEDPIAKLMIEHMRSEEGEHFEDLEKLTDLIKQAPLQPKKGQKGTDIVCDTE